MDENWAHTRFVSGKEVRAKSQNRARVSWEAAWEEAWGVLSEWAMPYLTLKQ